MSFIETPRFPDGLARNLQMRTRRKTTVTPLASGFDVVNVEWSQPRVYADAATAVRTIEDFEEILDWFHVSAGHAFRVRDWSDYVVTIANGELQPVTALKLDVGASGVGYGMPVHQLVKHRARGAYSHRRRIRKPVAGSVTVYRNAVAVTAGGGPGQISIDSTTGEVTFVADDSRSITSVAVGATTVLTLSAAVTGLTAGMRVYVSGCMGADAALINGASHQVTDVTGANLTIALATAGKTITAGAGVAAKFPQASDALTWAGQFDLPMRFDSDQPEYEVIGRTGGGKMLVRATNMPLIEVRT